MILLYVGIGLIIFAGLLYTLKLNDTLKAETIKGEIQSVEKVKRRDDEGFTYYVYIPYIKVVDDEERQTRFIKDKKVASRNKSIYYPGKLMNVYKIPTNYGYKYLLRKSYYHVPFYIGLIGIMSLVMHYFVTY